ncbi:MAG: MMPL family transporter, partial [Parvularculaceae bacterium]|nr:MMPL family transporter [Parvularculaceae bacterium]
MRDTAKSLGLTAENGVTVRLTGSAVVADEELSSLAHNMLLIAALMVAAIIVMLWFATHSVRAIVAILLTTYAGLAFAAAFGLYVFGAFNVISVAFIPLFVGLGIDFGIQLAVRFRAEQREGDGAGPALRRAAASMGRSLAIAATAISVGFLAFYPTDYIGLSQLGAIAGGGLVIAFFLSITLLPALLRLWTPGGSLPETNFAPIAAIDSFVLGRRRVVLAISAAIAIGSALLMPLVRFDFNPLHLRDQSSESIATLRALAKDDRLTPYFVSILAPSLAEADALAAKLAALPEVARVATVSRFVPKEQDAKLALIEDANFGLSSALSPIETAAAASDADAAKALAETATKLRQAADAAASDAPRAEAARRLATTLDAIASGPATLREAASDRVIRPLKVELDQIRDALSADAVTLESLPDELRGDWLAADGRARVSVYP